MFSLNKPYTENFFEQYDTNGKISHVRLIQNSGKKSWILFSLNKPHTEKFTYSAIFKRSQHGEKKTGSEKKKKKKDQKL